ncbi:MAG: T9SS type A sorting domain-containing protein, partial [Saprospiraceae bacterium]|nr:T9SS type A sorting domain-containing protein [Saprospiraceae bacterium]
PNFQQAPVEDREINAKQGLRHQVYPNPVVADGVLHVQFDQPGTAVFRLFDEKGRAIRVEKFEGQTQVRLNGLSAGVYAYSIEGGVAMVFGRVVVD